MLTETGAGTLAGGAHTETFRQIARGDAAALSEVMQREIDLPLLAEAFPVWPVQAYFDFAPAAGGGGGAEGGPGCDDAGGGGVFDGGGELGEKTGYQIA
jgi:hypothetical protein